MGKKLKELPVVSAILVIINVIVFLICTFTDELLYNKGILAVQPILWDKEYCRIVWAMFLHSDFNHIFNNMVILFFLGAMVERTVGHIRFGMVYLLSGIGGNLLSLLVKILKSETVGTIGASGAIFGLDGMLLALVLLAGGRMPGITPGRVLLMILCSLYGGYAGASIDNAAHLGGLLTGFLLGIVMCICDRLRNTMRRRNP